MAALHPMAPISWVISLTALSTKTTARVVKAKLPSIPSLQFFDPIAGSILPRDLVGGILQPLTGVLANLEVPIPQSQGLAKVPDDAHTYIAPGPTDVRGLCPTLNTLANHGYISRDGITTFAEAANAVQTAYAISYDLAAVLSLLGVLAGGDLATGKYSISGEDSRVPNTLGPAYGIDSTAASKKTSQSVVVIHTSATTTISI
ncbi:Cloroperoxidase [Stipitochalara longipes BDJ]|nr:Cloroperoxidase [Stipitochalara longipes BDJ]